MIRISKTLKAFALTLSVSAVAVFCVAEFATAQDVPNADVMTAEPADETRLQDVQSTMLPQAITPNAPESPPAPSNDQKSENAAQPTIQEMVRKARRSGLILPYSTVLARLKKTTSGKVVKVWLDDHRGKFWSYEFVVLEDSGRMLRISVHGKTAKVIRTAKR